MEKDDRCITIEKNLQAVVEALDDDISVEDVVLIATVLKSMALTDNRFDKTKVSCVFDRQGELIGHTRYSRIIEY